MRIRNTVDLWDNFLFSEFWFILFLTLSGAHIHSHSVRRILSEKLCSIAKTKTKSYRYLQTKYQSHSANKPIAIENQEKQKSDLHSAQKENKKETTKIITKC